MPAGPDAAQKAQIQIIFEDKIAVVSCHQVNTKELSIDAQKICKMQGRNQPGRQYIWRQFSRIFSWQPLTELLDDGQLNAAQLPAAVIWFW